MRSIQARLSLALVLALPALLALCAWLAAGALVSPPRRTLQPQHREWLDEPAAQALVSRLTPRPGRVDSVESKPWKESPKPPFTTSTIPQEANR